MWRRSNMYYESVSRGKKGIFLDPFQSSFIYRNTADINLISANMTVIKDQIFAVPASCTSLKI